MAARRRSNKSPDIAKLALIAAAGYIVATNWGSLKTIGGAAASKISSGIDSVAAAANPGDKP